LDLRVSLTLTRHSYNRLLIHSAVTSSQLLQTAENIAVN